MIHVFDVGPERVLRLAAGSAPALVQFGRGHPRVLLQIEVPRRVSQCHGIIDEKGLVLMAPGKIDHEVREDVGAVVPSGSAELPAVLDNGRMPITRRPSRQGSALAFDGAVEPAAREFFPHALLVKAVFPFRTAELPLAGDRCCVAR